MRKTVFSLALLLVPAALFAQQKSQGKGHAKATSAVTRTSKAPAVTNGDTTRATRADVRAKDEAARTATTTTTTKAKHKKSSKTRKTARKGVKY